ncbi:serine/threonine-protein kinase [Geodermatophilus sp. CPCC 205506]|uniref:serine/threonine-protein kinase n=1 Tax=Geodermatophilus sp. CPCC 205506 TaxID=2936596 RepID=UPI003EE94A39
MDLQQFGAYRIEALLGRGGMGEVYRAFDTEHDRVVALKVLSEHLAADAGYRERFRREAHLAARLNEPHIVPIHRFGEIDGRLFLDMRLVPGRDVAAVLAEEGPMDPARAVSVISQTARALDAAHADGLVHRDVKPSNILLSGQGEDEFVHLVDFGIARSTNDSSGPSLTRTGAALGSFDYMAPERFLEQPIDQRVDVYALACVLFECLTGRRPFTGDGLATLMFAHLNNEPEAPSAVRPGLPPALDAVVRKGLAKDRDQRYGSCGELAAAARAALKESGVTPQHVPSAPPTSITPMPFTPQTIGFSHPGGYGPPSDPGGYGPPSHPGGYGPPSDPGGYGPPSDPGPRTGFPAPGYPPPAGPGGYPVPGSPAPGGRTPNRLPLILGAVAVAVVAVVVGIIALTRGGDEPTTPASSDTSTSSSAASSTSTSASTTPATDPQDELLAILPGGFDPAACRPDTAGDGELAGLGCGPATAQPGPTDSAFYLYEDAAKLDEVFLADMERNGVTRLGQDQNCPDTQGYQPYTINQQDAGQVACYVDADNNSFLIWTQDEYGAEGIVVIANGGPEGLRTLVTWWLENANSDFG